MKWGIYRVVVFSLAFLVGTWVASALNPPVSATSDVSESAELSPNTGASLLVTCDDGNPTVEQVRGNDGALQVKCAKSQMHVVRSRPILRESRPPIKRPAVPFAYLLKPVAIPSE
jgi:hypothetical protein